MSLTPGVNIQTFSAAGSFTWVKYKGAKIVKVQMLSGGGGGSNGVVSAPGAVAGLAGSQGGGYGESNFPASALPDTVTAIVGAGGSGGIAGGAAATAGGNSSFGNFLFTRGGLVAQINGRGGGFPGGYTAAQNALSVLVGGDASPATSIGYLGAAGGGTGGGFSSNVAVTAPNPGGTTQPLSVTAGGAQPPGLVVGAAGGLAGAPNGGDGNDTIPGAAWGGSGGGGGLSQVAGNAGNGGKGIKGGGGGAGGQAFTGFTAGNGGNGGDGYIVVTTYFE